MSEKCKKCHKKVGEFDNLCISCVFKSFAKEGEGGDGWKALESAENFNKLHKKISPLSGEFKELDKNIHCEFTDRISSHVMEEAREFDKTLIVLAAGSLVISITFISNMSEYIIKPLELGFLLASWALFILTIFSVLAGVGYSIISHSRTKDLYDMWYVNDGAKNKIQLAATWRQKNSDRILKSLMVRLSPP